MALEWKVPKEESSDECIKMKAFLEEKGANGPTITATIAIM
ncbi:MAG: hypothetical protein PUC61_08870 [Bacteroidales bacterium]|nr:hypothetical protein [Bacteroidales bacterium]